MKAQVRVQGAQTGVLQGTGATTGGSMRHTSTAGRLNTTESHVMPWHGSLAHRKTRFRETPYARNVLTAPMTPWFESDWWWSSRIEWVRLAGTSISLSHWVSACLAKNGRKTVGMGAWQRMILVHSRQ